MACVMDKQIKELFKKEIATIRYRSFRAAKMEYHQASKYDVWLERLEYCIYYLIFFGVLIGYFTKSAVGGTLLATPGLLVTIFDALNKVYCSKNATDYVPILRARAVTHNNAAAKWQWLRDTAESHLIMMNQPDIPVKTVQQWHSKLCEERRNICANVIVQQDVYEDYNDPQKIKSFVSDYDEINELLKSIMPSLEVGRETPRIRVTGQEKPIFSKINLKYFVKIVSDFFKPAFKLFMFFFSLFLPPLFFLAIVHIIVFVQSSLDPLYFFHSFFNICVSFPMICGRDV